MTTTSEKGRDGEIMACDYLASKGYSILETNWRHRKLELDIIATKDNRLHFIEVKLRSDTDSDAATKAVNMLKQNNLINAANAYLATIENDPEISFDIIAIQKNMGEFSLEHIVDAFYPGVS